MHVKSTQYVNKEIHASDLRIRHNTLYFRFRYLKANMLFELKMCTSVVEVFVFFSVG
jgi:hypothetical protein